MTRTSITSTALALLSTNEQDEMMSNKNTAFEDRNQGAIIAPLRFIIPQREKPVFRSAALTGGQEEFFFETEEQMVPINDLRSVTAQMTLDNEGFTLLSKPSTVANFYDDSEVESRLPSILQSSAALVLRSCHDSRRGAVDQGLG